MKRLEFTCEGSDLTRYVKLPPSATIPRLLEFMAGVARKGGPVGGSQVLEHQGNSFPQNSPNSSGDFAICSQLKGATERAKRKPLKRFGENGGRHRD